LTPGRVLLGVVALVAPLAVGATTVAPAHAAAAVDWTVLVGNESSNMAIQGQRFLPGDITIDAGDSVTWQANSAEVHTVTFIDGGKPQSAIAPLDPTDGAQITPQGGSSMTGSGYYNSGMLTTAATAGPLPVPPVSDYTLSFPNAGTYTYYCLVHGMAMRGVVHVQPAATAYPATQADYDADAAFLAKAIVADGRAVQSLASSLATSHKVYMGPDDGIAMVMRFLHSKVVIHKGEKVRFLNTMSAGAPHTVTFGTKPAGLGIFTPSGDPTNYKGGDLHSGIIPPQGKFVVTFKKAGKFHYVCMLHQDMGMKGVVVVKP
jgi:plastocyanin